MATWAADTDSCGSYGGGSAGGEDGPGCSLLEAFEDFEAQSECRTAALIAAADQELYSPSQEVAPARDLPEHVYWSDQYRQTKPPEFQRWRDRFLYLQAEGQRLQDGESTEHIQLIPAPNATEGYSLDQDDVTSPLCLVGRTCLHDPPYDDSSTGEELIEVDGVLEEILVEQEDIGSQVRSDATNDPNPCLSPRSSKLEEELNALTVDTFASAVTPMLTSLFKTILQTRQARLRMAREAAEAKEREDRERQRALEEQERLLLEQQQAEEAARQEAEERERIEAERLEAERQAVAMEEHVDENDEEEAKIRTLAYTHTREWFQPNKKCYSHRGRQLTYLTPVLKAKEAKSPKHDPGSSTDQIGLSTRFVACRPPCEAPEALETRADDEVAPANGMDPPPKEYTRLPLITTPNSGRRWAPDKTMDQSGASPNSSGRLTTRGLSNAYATSPYRIPPPLLVGSPRTKASKKAARQRRES